MINEREQVRNAVRGVVRVPSFTERNLVLQRQLRLLLEHDDKALRMAVLVDLRSQDDAVAAVRHTHNVGDVVL